MIFKEAESRKETLDGIGVEILPKKIYIEEENSIFHHKIQNCKIQT